MVTTLPNGKAIACFEGDDQRPAVLFIHGGGWTMGDYTVFEDEARQLSDEYDAYSCDYTLASKTSDPVWEQTVADVACAVQWVRGRKADRPVYLVGASAGGHLALWHAAHHDDVDGVVAISAPVDLERPRHPGLAKLVRLWAGDDCERASVPPVALPPVCLIVGADDPLVRPEHSVTLAASLARRGGLVDLHYCALTGHDAIELPEAEPIIRGFLQRISPAQG